MSLVRRVEHDPGVGWIARDKFGVEYLEPGFRWNSRSVAWAVVNDDRLYGGDIGVEAYQRQRLAEALGRHLAKIGGCP